MASDVNLELRPLPSTGITRRLRYYGPIRRPGRPGRLLAELRFGAHAAPPSGFPVLHRISVGTHAIATTPAGTIGCCRSSRPLVGSLPLFSGGSAPALTLSRPARRSLTLRPACSLGRPATLFLKYFDVGRYLPPSLRVLPAGATSCRVGFSPTEDSCLFTAYAKLEVSSGSRGQHDRGHP